MNITILILGAVRAILIALVLRYVGTFIDSYKPKTKFWKRIWKDDAGVRKWLINRAWQIGALIFLGHFFYAITFGQVEDIKNYKDTLGQSCQVSAECQTPMDYLIQSNCPFGSACINNKCRVVCPLFYHDPNPEVSKSYPYQCTKDSDCNCEWRGERTIDCKCLEGSCVSVEA